MVFLENHTYESIGFPASVLLESRGPRWELKASIVQLLVLHGWDVTDGIAQGYPVSGYDARNARLTNETNQAFSYMRQLSVRAMVEGATIAPSVQLFRMPAGRRRKNNNTPVQEREKPEGSRLLVQ